MKIGLCIISLFFYQIVETKNLAVVIAPVVDVGTPQEICIGHNHKRIDIPASNGLITDKIACHRVHQLIFNEVVEVLEEKEGKYHIKIPNIFLIDSKTKRKENSFWVDKQGLILIKNLKKRGIDIAKIPEAIAYNNPQIDKENIATLALPYKEQSMNMIFSAGTRFKIAHTTPSSHRVYVLNPHTLQFNIIEISNDYIINKKKLETKKRAQFVQLLRSWAHVAQGAIPYIWGGNSFVFVSSNQYNHVVGTIDNQPTSFFELNDYQFNPKPGLDCSGLILRAAQICGIPYFCKNSFTIATHLKKIEQASDIQEGDIIWIPGHVMVISSLARNMIIEARSYSHGYGKIHEIALHKVFKDVNTFGDLLTLYKEKKLVTRLDSNGNGADSFDQYKIMRLSSVWDPTT